jgi:hypothetical protein
MKSYGVLIAAGAALMQVGSVEANDVAVRINNMSGRSISAIFASPTGESTTSAVNLLPTQVGAAETSEITVASMDTDCVYDLEIQFGDGSSLDRPDVDLCHTDELVIE